MISPADFFLFVTAPKAAMFFMPEYGDVETEVLAKGERCDEYQVPVKSDDLGFGNVSVGDKIVFRAESVYHKFEQDGQEIYCLPIREVKCCFPH